MIALVTGASSGLGAATARRLAGEPGAHLVLVARRRERLDELAAELGGATVIAADLLEEATPALVGRRVEDEHGRLDLLVNNAGVGGRMDGVWRQETKGGRLLVTIEPFAGPPPTARRYRPGSSTRATGARP